LVSFVPVERDVFCGWFVFGGFVCLGADVGVFFRMLASGQSGMRASMGNLERLSGVTNEIRWPKVVEDGKMGNSRVRRFRDTIRT
jgi:hypothetical protein